MTELESSAECITSAVCSSNPCLVSLVLTVAPHPTQGRRTFNITLNHPTFYDSNPLQGTITPLGPETFTHNIVGVLIIIACTKVIDDNTDLVGACASGLGGREEQTDGIVQISSKICFKCACHFFILFSLSWHDRRRKPLLHDTATDDTQHLTPIRAP
jgi:hypothetical protein